MTLSKTSRIENKSKEGLDFFYWEDREKIRKLYRANRVLAKLKKIKFTSSTRVLPIRDFPYQWVKFWKKFNKDSISVEFFISLDKEKIPRYSKNQSIRYNQILVIWAKYLFDILLTRDINSEWEVFINHKTHYFSNELPFHLRSIAKELSASDSFGHFSNLIEKNGNRLEYKKESDEIVRFRIV